jgi:hypothetical protein
MRALSAETRRQGRGAYIAGEEDAERGEKEAALCLFRCLAAAERTIGEGDGGERVGGMDRDVRGFKFCTRLGRNLPRKHMTHIHRLHSAH